MLFFYTQIIERLKTRQSDTLRKSKFFQQNFQILNTYSKSRYAKTFHLGHVLFKLFLSISSNCTHTQQMFHDLSIKVMHKAKLYIPSTIKTQMLLLGTTENQLYWLNIYNQWYSRAPNTKGVPNKHVGENFFEVSKCWRGFFCFEKSVGGKRNFYNDLIVVIVCCLVGVSCFLRLSV